MIDVFQLGYLTRYRLLQKIWDSGIGLSSWLVQLKEDHSLVQDNVLLQDLKQTLFSEEPKKVLELGTVHRISVLWTHLLMLYLTGAGIGIVSATLSVLRSSFSTRTGQDCILATDVRKYDFAAAVMSSVCILKFRTASAMPLLMQNISTNEKYYLSGAPKPIVLDWDDEDLPEEVTSLQDDFDAIV